MFYVFNNIKLLSNYTPKTITTLYLRILKLEETYKTIVLIENDHKFEKKLSMQGNFWYASIP